MAQFIYFLREVFYFSVFEYAKKKHICEFYHSKIEKLIKTNTFFSHFEGTRGVKNQIFRTLDDTDDVVPDTGTDNTFQEAEDAKAIEERVSTFFQSNCRQILIQP